MGVHILTDASDEHAIMYCSTTDWAFGPVIQSEDSAYDRAERFIKWLPQDARKYTDRELELKYSEFLKVEPELIRAESAEDE